MSNKPKLELLIKNVKEDLLLIQDLHTELNEKQSEINELNTLIQNIETNLSLIKNSNSRLNEKQQELDALNLINVETQSNIETQSNVETLFNIQNFDDNKVYIPIDCEIEGKFKFEDIDGFYYMTHCPWCYKYTQIEEKYLNCTIFRCGNLKTTLEPLNPHLPKHECDYLFNNNLIHGCSKPFKFNGINIEKCDYI